ncbi:putative circadian clock protein, KaiC [Caldicellulosiruptor saccharolyticus DSM 8903]|uniref:Circadian clock protein, KaiC n=1 Tax=Caldicellulosiruptor saccharolyticus (strain ATCC 43494 / DSM 8903 / Tp8T 6331) TaxID=351627 RepID=A4XK90_CALS8|nr:MULTISPECIES: KaiC domain-containing protein [Caldicellulosiruptor]ABP67325.1 putative circadian clock protein, KaiC [Caldicellulosiruptor saccharolyticus DSM 8903]
MNKTSSEVQATVDAVKLKDLSKSAPELFGVKTGVDGIDKLFYKAEFSKETGKPVVKPLGGIPAYSVINLSGVADTGKSLFAEQFAVTQANEGNSVLYITVETPAEFLYSSLLSRAAAMNIDKSKVEENVYMLDITKDFNIRGNINNFIKTIENAATRFNIKNVVIDSVTGLFESKEIYAREIVRTIYNFLKSKRLTTLMISQKRSGQEHLSAEAAGGYAVSHIVDGTIVFSKQVIMNRFDSSTFKRPIGDVIRLLRVDGCRMCGHDSKTYVFEIEQNGLIKVLYPLGYIAGQQKEDKE